MDELQQLYENDKKTVVKLKDIYRSNKHWSSAFFKAGKELERMNDNIDMTSRYGFHLIELIN